MALKKISRSGFISDISQKPGTTMNKRKVRVDRVRIKGTKLAAAKLAVLFILLAAKRH